MSVHVGVLCSSWLPAMHNIPSPLHYLSSTLKFTHKIPLAIAPDQVNMETVKLSHKGTCMFKAHTFTAHTSPFLFFFFLYMFSYVFFCKSLILEVNKRKANTPDTCVLPSLHYIKKKGFSSKTFTAESQGMYKAGKPMWEPAKWKRCMKDDNQTWTRKAKNITYYISVIQKAAC